MTGKTRDGLRETFDAILAELIKTIGASRTTLRLDDAAYGFHIDDVVGRGARAGREFIAWADLDQSARGRDRAMGREEPPAAGAGRSFVGEPRAPDALIKLYGVRAQMLAPVERQGRLDGWISVHEARGPRNWTEQDQAALRKAAAEVLRALG